MEIAEYVKFWMSMEEAHVLEYLSSHHRRHLKVKETAVDINSQENNP